MPFSPSVGARRCAIALAMLTVPVTAALAVAPTDSYAGGQGWAGLSRPDLDRMSTAAALLYEGSPGNTVERWTSPVSGKSGEIRLVGSFEFRGMPCRKLDYVILSSDHSGYPPHYVMSWCQVQGGAWKIVEVPTQH